MSNLDKHITNLQDEYRLAKSNRTRFNNFQKKWKKREKQKEREKKKKEKEILTVRELLDLDHKGEFDE